MKVLYVIPARGGSKGLPGKNIRPLNGKPLIYYTIDAAREVSDDINICVSTDDKKIIETVEQYGLKIPFVRPAELATDYATSEQVLKHAIKFYESNGQYYDFVALLQPTSPLRTGQHLIEALQLLKEETEMIVSVKETDSNPYYVLFEEGPTGVLQKAISGNYSRRQDCPKIYQINGAIYIINIKKLQSRGISDLKKKKYLMEKRDSIDIDDEVDWKLASILMS
ncbi:acylneuraminate cytidylyltransferase family protein [Pontibacter chinhatensis]|uniref:N-acylneuraminate cytidylyltransferase n=1 Tax=Pontibacter chinhatensis TaxID=1436961 RepID=A0A1I2R5A7_9BACT|nr:acylneuraminate cytidylyltransferase family protein [Pontibacter chinhatensis]SFG32966.1 N-acylneuraminate cytidylyltransferase [Pontibacter chinhatensis]